MAIYRLYWDEFSSWYLEIVKPAYGQPIDAKTFEATCRFFDTLLRLLHPFMPFITEELWQHLAERKPGELPKPFSPNTEMINEFDHRKEVVAGIRTVRKQKQLPQRESLKLCVKGTHNPMLNAVLVKMGNLSEIESVEEKNPASSAFIVGATEYSIPLAGKINTEEERARLEKDLEYYKKFLGGVEKKLANEKFVANAPEAVVAVERKKKSDAEEKIAAITAALAALG